MSAPTPKNPSTSKATQTNMALSFTTANPDGYPIAYDSDVWDTVEQGTAMSDVMEGTGQYDQKTINEQLAGKIGSIDLSVFERIANKVIAISAQSTDVQYPTAKLLYDSLQALANVYAAKANTYTKTEVDNLISSISTVSFVVVATLPTTDIQTNVIYLVPSSTAQQQNIYDEYIYSNNAWEHIGSTVVDLSGYELKINKVTSISAQSTDNEYPSAKLLYNSLQALSNVFARIADLASVAFSGSYNDLSNKPTIPAAQVNSDWNSNSGVSQILNKPNVEVQGNKVTVLSPQNTDAQYPSAKAVYDCCAEVKEFLEDLDERVTRLEGFHYMITGAALQGTIVIEMNGELYTYQVSSDNAYEFKYKEPIQTLDFRAANIVSVSFYDSDSLIGLVSCDELFKNCVELIAVDFANKTFASVISATDMFAGCISLTTLTCPNSESWKPDLNFSDCEDLTQASLESLIDNFLFVYSSGDHVITPNQIMWGRISHADQDSIIARATAKGWQLNVGSRYNISGTSNGSVVNITVDGTAVTVPVENGIWSYGYDNTLSSISFANDTHVQTIDFSLSDGLSGITSLALAFSGCTALTSVVFTDCNLLNVTNASGAFGGCSALANLTIPANYWKPDVSFTDSPLITYSEMLDIISGLYYYPSGTHTITWNASTWDSFSIEDQLSIIQAADLKGWDTNSVSNIYYVRGTSSNVNGTETFNIQFINDGALLPSAAEQITCNVDANGNWEFSYIRKKIYGLTSFAAGKTTLLTADFSDADDFSQFMLSGTSMGTGIFSGCTNLTSVSFENQLFSSCTEFGYSFYNCSKIVTINMRSATFALLQAINRCFEGCVKLETLNLSSATFANVNRVYRTFYNCNLLNSLSVPQNSTAILPTSTAADASIDLHWSPLDYTSMLKVANWLSDLTGYAQHSVTFNDTEWSNLSMAQQLIISNILTNKNWACNSVQYTYYVRGTSSNVNGTETFNIQYINDGAVNPSTAEIVTCNVDANGNWEFSYKGKKIYSLNNFCNTANAANTSLLTINFADADDMNAVTAMNSAFWRCSNLNSIVFGNNQQINNCTHINRCFANCTSLTNNSIVWGGVTFNSVTAAHNQTNINEAGLFQGCTGLTAISLPFAWPSLLYANNMFRGCTALTSVSFPNATFASVLQTRNMFNGCTALTTAFGLSDKTFASLQNASDMFYGCNHATLIDLSSATFASLQNAGEMFMNCTALTSINLSNKTFASLQSAVSMFQGCNHVTSIDLTAATFGSLTNTTAMFYSCSALASLIWPNANLSTITTVTGGSGGSANGMFRGCSSIIAIPINNMNFNAITNIGHVFDGCSSLTSIDLSSYTFASLQRADSTFEGCSALTSLNLSSATFASLQRADAMFKGCSSLASITWSNNLNFNNIVSIGGKSGNTYRGMFMNCTSLTSINWHNQTFPNLTDVAAFVYGCSSLVSVDLASATMSNVSAAEGTFGDCPLLTSIDISSATFANVTTTFGNYYELFRNCSSLTTLDVPQNSTAILPTSTPINAPMDLHWSPLTYASILKVANWLSDLTGQTAHTCTFNATTWDNLSAADQTTIDGILSSKNWNRAIA